MPQVRRECRVHGTAVVRPLTLDACRAKCEVENGSIEVAVRTATLNMNA